MLRMTAFGDFADLLGSMAVQTSIVAYQPITMFDSIALRERSRSEPVFCM